MKLKIFFLFLVAVVASSCEKLLEPDPNLTGAELSSNAYVTYRGALQGINGLYSRLRNVYVDIYFLDELSDDSFGGNSRAVLDENILDVFNGQSAGVWANAYSTIGRINIYLDRVPLITGLSINEEILKKQYIAEAKVLRALMYFNLVRLFGDVPLVITEETEIDKLQIPRTAASLVYAQIQKDLTEAIVDLPAAHPSNRLVQPIASSLNTAGREKGRVTSILAKAILGEVYLTKKEFANADQFFTQTLADAAANGVTLNNIFSQNFEALSNLELTNESLLEVGFASTGTLPNAQHSLPAQFGPPEDNISFSWNTPTDKSLQINATFNNTLAEAFVAGDLRKNATIKYNFIEYPSTTTVPRSINAKYWQRGLQGLGTANWNVYRLADIILLASEAKQALGQDAAALTLLNTVRAHPRTGLSAYPVTLTGNPLRDAIRLERRLELAMEAKRYYDLLRWGTLTPVMAAHGFPVNPIKNGLLPIPQGEREKNTSMTQNPGYN